MLTPDRLMTTVEGALAATLGEAFARAEIRQGENYEGQRSIYIKAYLKADRDRPSSRSSLENMVALRQALDQAGEEREPYLDLDYPRESAR